MDALSNSNISVHFFSDLKTIELRTWDSYFPKQKKRFAKLVTVLNDLRKRTIESIPTQEILNKESDVFVVDPPAYKKAFDKIDFKSLRNHPAVKKGIDAFRPFYPEFLNVYAFQVANADELGMDERIFALHLIRDSIEKESVLFNVNMFSYFRVALNFINEKLPQLQLERKEVVRVYNAVRLQIEAEDFYYWPLRIEKAEGFFNALETYKLIAPRQKCQAAFQERFDSQNQIVWIGENKQLIYLMFLLYKNQRSFKGLGIHEIACRVFKQDPELLSRSLNNQLRKIVIPNSTIVRREVIDESLVIIEDLVRPFLL